MTAPVPLLLRKYLLLVTAALNKELTGADVAVLAALLERFNDHAGAAWPSLVKVAADTQRNRATVVRSLQRLTRAGFIVLVSRGNSKRCSNRYRPCFELGAPMQLVASTHPSTSRIYAPPTSRMDAPLTHTTEPVRVQRGDYGAAADAGLGAVTAAPEGLDKDEWTKLITARTDLDAAELAEAVALHRQQGCPAEALNHALKALRLQRGHKSLSPAYKRLKSPAKSRSNGRANSVTRASRPPVADRFDDVNYLEGL